MADPAPATVGVDHVGLSVRNLESTRRFFCGCPRAGCAARTRRELAGRRRGIRSGALRERTEDPFHGAGTKRRSA